MTRAVKQQPVPLYEELLALPEQLTGEIIGGELHVQPRPAGKHAVAQGGLNVNLGGPFGFGRGGPGGWWIIPEPEIHFVRDTEVVVPDLAGWRGKRMPTVPEDHRFEVAPDWVCEILSPGTVKKDRVLKLPLYARYGVAHAWLIDPGEHLLEAFALREGAWVLIAVLQEDDAVQVPPFDSVSFALSDLWA